MHQRPLRALYLGEHGLGAPVAAAEQGIDARQAGERFFSRRCWAAGYERQDEYVFASNQPINDKLERCINRDGSTGWYLAQKFPLHDPQQRLIALAGISMDLKTPAGDDPALATLGAIIWEIQRDCAKPLRMEDLAQKAKICRWSLLERMMRTVIGLDAAATPD